MGPGYVPTFLYYFVGTTFIAVFVLSKGADDLTFNPFQVAVPFGLVVAGFGAALNSHRTISLPIKNKGGFVKSLNEALAELGYQETSTLDEFTVYQRSGLGKVFSGKLFINLDNKTATISGRSTNLKVLEKKLQS